MKSETICTPNVDLNKCTINFKRAEFEALLNREAKQKLVSERIKKLREERKLNKNQYVSLMQRFSILSPKSKGEQSNLTETDDDSNVDEGDTIVGSDQ